MLTKAKLDLCQVVLGSTPRLSLCIKGISFWRNCGAASVGEWYTKIWFINGVHNVSWPPYRDWKAVVSSVSPSSERMTLCIILTLMLAIRSDEGLTLETSAFQSLYGGQFTLSTPLINQILSLCIANWFVSCQLGSVLTFKVCFKSGVPVN